MGFVLDASSQNEVSNAYMSDETVFFVLTQLSRNVVFDTQNHFLCSETAHYMFTLHYVVDAFDHSSLSIVKQGVELVAVETGDDFYESSGTTSVVTECQAGQSVWVRCHPTNLCFVKGTTRFTGRKLIGQNPNLVSITEATTLQPDITTESIQGLKCIQ